MKRSFDVILASAGLIVLSPLFVVIALVIKIDSAGPALFRQIRVGKRDSRFEILKFRTMTVSANGPAVTSSNDSRVTRVGRILRLTKLDELPQLCNVLRGDMSLVGPRPELPRFVDLWSPEQRAAILSVRPGITDPASIQFRHEAEILAAAPNAEQFYADILLDMKASLYEEYVRNQTFRGDLAILFGTLRAILMRTSDEIPHAGQPSSHAIELRPLRESDARRAAEMHTQAFPSFFLSSLGSAFLRELYAAFARDDRVVAVAATSDSEILAVAAGPLEPAGFFKKLARRNAVRFALAAAPAVLRRPSIACRVMRGINYRGTKNPVGGALLSTLSVSPRAQRLGLGTQILEYWMSEVCKRGVTTAHLTTDRYDNSGTIEFYERSGWMTCDTHVTPEGREMLVLGRDLQSS